MRRFTRNLRIGCGSVEEKPNCRLRDEQSWQCGLVLDQEGASAPGERMKYFCSQYGKSGPREMTCWLREAAHSQKLKFRSRYPHDKLCLQCLPYYSSSEERRGRNNWLPTYPSRHELQVESERDPMSKGSDSQRVVEDKTQLSFWSFSACRHAHAIP